MDYYNGLPEILKTEFLRPYRHLYAELPYALREKVDREAEKDNLFPALYLMGCDRSDALGQEIAAFEHQLRQSRADDPARQGRDPL